ncbi:glycine oxidase ThiO [Salimicrobium sp. PL1-032A]|uniref:glycine oxidase ThiO n=1 Tax=Salimicrobium sp. PL1-032A TaxID=3095364 RepID=UPI0032611F5F
MTQHYETIVIGAGVIGSSIAYHLSRRGRRVLLLEQETIACKASSAAAGMLGAQSELKADGSPLFELAKESRAMFPDLADDLKMYSGMDISLKQQGIYKIARNEEEKRELRHYGELQRQSGQNAEWLEAEELQIREPAVSSQLTGGLFLPDDGQVSAPDLSRAFALSAIELGTTLKEYTKVQSLLIKGDSISGVSTNGGEYQANEVVIACGAWSEEVLGEALDTYPVKGECFSVNTKRNLISGTLFSKDCYIVPKSGGRLVVGATEQPGTYDETVTLGGVFPLIKEAIRLLPELAYAEWESAWTGLRPQTRNETPVLGPHPDYRNLFLATGHYRNGILLSPITGKLIADMIEGTPVPEQWITTATTINQGGVL